MVELSFEAYQISIQMYDSLDIYERLGSYIDTNCCLLTAECLEKILQSEKN